MKSKTIFVAAGFFIGFYSGSIAVTGVQARTNTEEFMTVNQKKSAAAKNEGKYFTGLQDFDFLVGEWKVHHRRIDPKTQKWVEFDGTCSNRKLTEGWANVEEHKLNAPSGAYTAVALRSYDSQNNQWAIWWLDSRYPSGRLDPSVKGRFENGTGTFYADYVNEGKPMRVRFLWSEITSASARWEQSVSSDGGKTWETNWIMSFQRIS